MNNLNDESSAIADIINDARAEFESGFRPLFCVYTISKDRGCIIEAALKHRGLLNDTIINNNRSTTNSTDLTYSKLLGVSEETIIGIELIWDTYYMDIDTTINNCLPSCPKEFRDLISLYPEEVKDLILLRSEQVYRLKGC